MLILAIYRVTYFNFSINTVLWFKKFTNFFGGKKTDKWTDINFYTCFYLRICYYNKMMDQNNLIEILVQPAIETIRFLNWSNYQMFLKSTICWLTEHNEYIYIEKVKKKVTDVSKCFHLRRIYSTM